MVGRALTGQRDTLSHTASQQLECGFDRRASPTRRARGSALAFHPRACLTVICSEHMNVVVRRSQRSVAILVVGLWFSVQMPWALAVLSLPDGSHHVSLTSLQRNADIVLHHHAVSQHDDEIAIHDHDRHDDHPHADHVIHASGTGTALAAQRLVPHSGPLQLIMRSSSAAAASALRGACARPCAFAATGPPSSLETVVLRI